MRTAKWVVLVVLLTGMASSVLAQYEPKLGVGAPVILYIKDSLGNTIATPPTIRMTSETDMVPIMQLPHRLGDGWQIEGAQPGLDYEVEVSVPGYHPATEDLVVPINGAESALIVFLRPIDKPGVLGNSPGGNFVMAPRAQKEADQALKDLNSNKTDSALKHIAKLLKMDPGNPYSNYLAGVAYLRKNQLPEAKTYLEKAASIDPKQFRTLLSLGSVLYRESDFAEAIKTLSQANDLNPKSWQAHWMLAICYQQTGNYEQARNNAKIALKLDEHDASRAWLVVGQSEAVLGDRQRAIAALDTFIRENPSDPNVPQAQRWVKSLEEQLAQIGLSASTATMATPASALIPIVGTPNSSAASLLTADLVETPPRENWAPPDIDAVNIAATSSASCPLNRLLKGAGTHAEDFVSDFERMTAVEEYQSVEIKRDGKLEKPDSAKFNYIVTVDRSNPRIPHIEETRNNGVSTADLPGYFADFGAPALELVLHSNFRKDFQWSCEGLGKWQDRPAWVLHFQQRVDRPTSPLESFENSSQRFLLPLKGRIWITESGDELVHMDVDIAKPIKEIDLRRYHLSLDYRPVSFPVHKVQLWLPETTDLYIQFHGRFFHNYHHFTDYKLFWVGTTQVISKPKEAPLKQN
ncbi:MAG TPA: tetratricopeptide repeat protein [Candidatus Acidoferrales bacterium]|nr:tetratricopeptide repeat protein [Candidatus Acidoferrales bacterium]